MIAFKEFLYDWMGGNEVLFLAINHIRSERYDQFMQTVSWLGDVDRFPMYMAMISVFVLLMLVIKMVRGDRGKYYYTTAWIGVLIMLVLGFVANAVITQSIKNHAEMPRPYVALAKTEHVNKLETSNPDQDYQSFPSGHVAFSTMMVVALSPVLATGLQVLGFIFILLVAWSRVSLGMHFPADVVGAFLITTFVISLLRYFVYKILRVVFNIKC